LFTARLDGTVIAQFYISRGCLHDIGFSCYINGGLPG
jgi:hypothetical protein